MKFAETVCVTVGVSVRTKSVPDVTLTTSVTWPTSSLVLSELLEPAFRVVSISWVLKPWSEIVTLYLPGARPGNEYCPDALVTCTGNFSPVETFVTRHVAPGTLPPSLSTTTPLSVALLVPPCPNTGAATRAHTNAKTDTHPGLDILPPPIIDASSPGQGD